MRVSQSVLPQCLAYDPDDIHKSAIFEKPARGGGDTIVAHLSYLSPPQEQFYGIEAIFKDGCGNWFSMTQRSAAQTPG